MKGLRAVVVLLLASASLVRADWKQDEERCKAAENKNADAAIEYCTAAINSGKLSGKSLSNGYVIRGKAYARKGEYDLAIRDYNEAINPMPWHWVLTEFEACFKIFFNLGSAYEGKGDYDQAIEDYNKSISCIKRAEEQNAYNYEHAYNPKTGEESWSEYTGLETAYAAAHNGLGRAWEKKGQHENAIKEFDEAIRLAPSNAKVWYARGTAKQKKGDTAGAAADIAKAKQLDPKLEARSAAPAANTPLPAADWKQAAERCATEADAELKLQYCSAAIDSRRLSGPSRGSAFRNRGAAYIAKGDYDRAIADFDQAIRLKSDDAEAFHGRGLAYHGKGDYDHAIQDFDQAIRLNANYAEAFFDRGRARTNQGEYDLAIKDYDEALRLKPNDALTLINRSIAYDNKGDHDRAIQDYDQVLRSDPNNGLAFHYRGIAYSNKGQYDRAIQDFDQAIRLNPNDAGAFTLRGDAYGRKADYDRAIRDYTEAIRLDPNDAGAFNSRGDAYTRKRDYDAAIKDLDQAIQMSPSFSQALSNRGLARHRKGDYNRAQQDLDEAIRLDPNDADALTRRGNLRIDQGDYPGAIRDFDEAIRLKPDDAATYYDRGRAQFHQGDFAAAQRDFANVASYPYPALWLYLAQARAGQSARAELAKNSAKMDLKAWPGPIINLFLGKATAASLLAAAKDANSSKDREQHCEAYFYLGQQAVIAGKQGEANRLFQQTLETGITTFVEYTGARAELQRFARVAAQRCRDDQKKDPGAAPVLRSCSDAIESGQLSGEALARTYNYRGTYFDRKGEYDAAIQDFTHAISLKTSQSAGTPAELIFDILAADPQDLLFNSTNVFATAFVLRGSAYAAKGDLSRAIQDYDQAVQIDKSYAKGFAARASAYLSSGNYDRAIRDYDEAIRLNPALAGLLRWYHERGLARFYLGQFAAAEKDFAASLESIPFPSSAIWRYLARAKAGQEARSQLAKDAAKMNLSAWPGPVINLYLGTATAESVLAAAKDANPTKDRDQRCEALFHLGQQALIAGKQNEARQFFRQTLETQSSRSVEHTVAQAELKRLQP